MLSRPWRRVCWSLTIVASLCSAPVFAQHAEANVLFDEGRAAMARRDYLQAIAKLEQSQQLDPAVGTLLNLAECYGLLGRSASAWSAYRDATSLAATTKQLERERFAARKAQELEPTLSHLVVRVRPEARIPGLSLTRNGVPFPEGLWGASVPVDPGAQHIEAKAPGYQMWKNDVDVMESGGSAQVEVPALTADAAVAPPSVAPPAAAAPAPTPQPLAPPRADGAARPAESSVQPTLGWVGVAAGAVALGAGVFVYADGRSKISDANCPNEICVRGVGDKSLHDDGRSHERLGVALGIAGLAVAGMGVSLLVLARSSDAKPATSMHLQLRLAATGLDLRGRF